MSRFSKRKRDFSGLIGVAIGLAALGVIGVAVWAVTICDVCRPEPLDADLCPQSGPVGFLAIVVDTTDVIGPAARKEIARILNARIDAQPAGTRIGLYLVTEDEGAERRKVLCHPGDASDVNILFASRRDAARRFEAEFRQPLAGVLGDILSGEAADTSPIVEAVRLATTDLLPYEDSRPQTIIVVSDMIQNSGTFSFFRGDTWPEFSASPNRAAFQLPLGGVSVEQLWIVRPDFWAKPRTFEELDLKLFWRQLVAESGANLRQLGTVPAG